MDYFIDEAKKEANKSMMTKKCGAILIHRGKIISRGYNFMIYHNDHNKMRFLCGKKIFNSRRAKLYQFV